MAVGEFSEFEVKLFENVGVRPVRGKFQSCWLGCHARSL